MLINVVIANSHLSLYVCDLLILNLNELKKNLKKKYIDTSVIEIGKEVLNV
ncbi:hypothetical protein [Peribacillus frigoritolerans]|uniref:Uncharacterized protein n=1 Tax=Peribacillus frigoritolerans TaxID=450367 RepID=A0AAJ1QJP0_9BACI|nr:hypothetical protein [Peribacillus frigoritolerans]MDM5282666.1 hypothetical protein [Peribacillus frigoritolerans]